MVSAELRPLEVIRALAPPPVAAAQLDRLTNQPWRPLWFGWSADDVVVFERKLPPHVMASPTRRYFSFFLVLVTLWATFR